jgi:PhnB protein
MAGKADPVPEGYHSVTPYLAIRGASEALAFYKKAFGAEELYRLDMPDGKIGHAEIRIGDSRIMLSDEFPEMADILTRSPQAIGGTTCGFNVYVHDSDALFQRALDAGGKLKRPMQDQFYGDRSGTLEDPFGHIWTLSTHIEDVSPEEMKNRMASLAPG